MIARSGNMQTAPIAPGKGHSAAVACRAVGTQPRWAPRMAYNGGSSAPATRIVAHAHPRSQGPDRAAARAARGLSVLQRGRRDDLRRQGAGAARPRAQLSRRLRRRARRPTRCSTRSTGSRCIVTDSVVEALALENNLIKQRAPKYNILLRDDKNYPYLQLTTGEAFPRVLVARRVERDGHFYAGPFLPARLARRTMALTHRLFGIRSCNEVITGKRGAPVPRVRHQALHRAVRGDDLLAGAVRQAVARHAAVPRGPERRAGRAAARSGWWRPPAASGTRRRRSCATRCGRCRRCASGSRRWRSAELGDRDVFGVKVGPGGAVVQVFLVRGGRVVERVELVDRRARRAAPSEEPDVLEAALQQFYETQAPPAEMCTCRPTDEREAMESGCAARAGRRVRVLVPQRGDKRGLVDLAHAKRRRSRTDARFDAERDRAITRRSKRCGPCCSCPALPRRIECFDISTIQGSRDGGVDGRLRRRPHEARASIASSASASAGTETGPAPMRARISARPGSAVPRRLRRDAAGRAAPLPRVLESGGPFPDLIVIDGGKGQLNAAYEALEELGLSQPGGDRHREEGGAGLHARQRAPIALVRTTRRCCCCSGFATRRTGSR